MVKKSVFLGSVFACALSLTGAVSAAQVSTDGSTSMEKVVGILAEAYHAAHPNVTVTYNPTGSGAGIAAAMQARTDIGLSSRKLKEQEAETLTAHVLAHDGIVVVVNKANPVKSLTMEEIGALYRGEVTNWKALGGEDRPVVLIGREAGSGTRDGFESVLKIAGKARYRQELTSTGDVLTMVSTNPNAVGYASLSALNKRVKALQVGGVTATKLTVQDGSYKLSRPFLMVVKKDAELSADAKAFLAWALSAESDALKERAGVIPEKRN